ncbi:hypothetical protein [Brevundimonas vesicularis]|nr:hypothetical protein [Brevundimonas vesicularis]
MEFEPFPTHQNDLRLGRRSGRFTAWENKAASRTGWWIQPGRHPLRPAPQNQLRSTAKRSGSPKDDKAAALERTAAGFAQHLAPTSRSVRLQNRFGPCQVPVRRFETMTTRKTLIRSRAGVRLQRIEHLARQQVVQSSWRLSTLRQNQPRSFADETEAEDAFDMEVIASLTDPIIMDMQRRGLID